MIYELKNEFMTAAVNTLGGTLWSMKGADQKELIWQGDDIYWDEKGPNIFPYIARMTEGKYTFRGETYEMGIHGFLQHMELEPVEHTENLLKLGLNDSEETRKQYPFAFRFEVWYRLEGTRLEITFVVKNKDDKTMYFGIGGHPGFYVPMEDGLAFEDYELEFAEAANPERVTFSADCFVTGRTGFALEDGIRIPLKHELFDDDAIVLEEPCRTVTLKSAKGKKGVRVEYPSMKYIGFWHASKTDAPYVCIEPWSSLPSAKGVVEDLEKQENLISLEAGGEYKNCWSIELL